MIPLAKRNEWIIGVRPENAWEDMTSEMKRINKKKGFTLVEIMIVVLIIGILLAIAVPNFLRARETSRTRTCVANLRQIEAGKEQWAMENNQGAAAVPVQGDLTPTYMKAWPVCPSGGNYTIGAVNANPTCSIGAPHAIN